MEADGLSKKNYYNIQVKDKISCDHYRCLMHMSIDGQESVLCLQFVPTQEQQEEIFQKFVEMKLVDEVVRRLDR